MHTEHGVDMQLEHNTGMHLNLRAFRKARGLNQEAMAEAMGVEQSNISRFENGKTHPSLETLYRAADYFECSVKEFFNPTEPDTPHQPRAVEGPSEIRVEKVEVVVTPDVVHLDISGDGRSAKAVMSAGQAALLGPRLSRAAQIADGQPAEPLLPSATSSS